ncbi:MAG TPA: hypothetical protein VL651_10705 [Bacteroidia bacterium]|jgi:hypothetical protein|nr:hypothetical protein [Bacteroidia bacterium]
MKKLFVFTVFLFFASRAGAQFWYDSGKIVKGKVRVIHNSIFIPGSNGGFNINYRTFSVDSVFPEATFGNHYKNLKAYVKQDPEASIYLINATHWETSQRYCIGGMFLWTIGLFIVPTNDPQVFNDYMYVGCGIGAGLLATYFIKRHWANKSIHTWNTHLDEGKYVYLPS